MAYVRQQGELVEGGAPQGPRRAEGTPVGHRAVAAICRDAACRVGRGGREVSRSRSDGRAVRGDRGAHEEADQGVEGVSPAGIDRGGSVPEEGDRRVAAPTSRERLLRRATRG